MHYGMGENDDGGSFFSLPSANIPHAVVVVVLLGRRVFVVVVGGCRLPAGGEHRVGDADGRWWWRSKYLYI